MAEESVKLYLDNCCYNRPFDEQNQDLIRLETEAKLLVQRKIKRGDYSLVWSFILNSENMDNPNEERREAIALWQFIAKEYCRASTDILNKAESFLPLGIKHKDALHLACAIKHKCHYLLTTDKKFLNKNHYINEITIINPISFVIEMENKNGK